MSNAQVDADMAIPLLATKLYVPPARPEWVSRPRLLGRLDAGLSRKLTLVSAPAGFGKTTLLSEWVYCRGGAIPPSQKSEIISAWLSLDEEDNDPTRFLAYLIAALQTIPSLNATECGADALAMLQSPQPPPTVAVLTSLLNDIAALSSNDRALKGRSFALVLDDYHLVKSRQIHDTLAYMLDHLPPQMHLVIATREDPLLPLARLRVGGEMTEIRASDLRFTPDETTVFLNQAMQLGLPPDEVNALETRTEGWIAGLHLAALSLQGRSDRAAFIRAFAGDDRHVMDYLVNEVLARQSEAVQRFLLHTAILERLSGPLCDAVAGSEDVPGTSQAILEYLEQANLFVVPLDNRREWYRYHHMFADLLRSRLHRAVGSHGLAALHVQASMWYERSGLVAEAIHHALAARDYERAVRLVEGCAMQMFMRSELATILRWVEALPAGLVRTRPWLCICAAWSLRLTGGQAPAVESHLRDAEWALEAYTPPLSRMDGASEPTLSADEVRTMRAHIATIRAYQALYREQMPRAIELAQWALGNLAQEDLVRGLGALALGWAVRFSGDLDQARHAFTEAKEASLSSGNLYTAVAATSRLAYTLVLGGQLHRAVASCQEALRLATGKGGRRLPVAGYALVYLGGIYREWDDLETAAHHLLEGTDLCTQVGYILDQIVGYVTLARVRQARGDEGSAGEALQNAMHLSQKMRGYVYAQRWVEDCQVRLWTAQRRLDAVARWVVQSELRVDDEINFLRELEHLILARALVALGRERPACGHLEDARKLLARLLEVAEAAGWMGKAIEILALQAVAYWACGDAERALIALQRALTLAEPEGYVRVFVDEGLPIARLLYRALARDMVRGPTLGYARRLLAAFKDTTQVDRPATRADLSSEVRFASSCREVGLEPLSERELEVLRLIAEGLTNREIAFRLTLAQSTVKVHTRNIYGKLDVHSRVQAAARARDLGLL
jgi:LuxR family maltose regulon positive regulatory protein